MAKNDLVIQIKNLKKSYGSHKVLKGVTFNVERGTMLHDLAQMVLAKRRRCVF